MVPQAEKSEFNIPIITSNKFRHVGGVTDHDLIELDGGASVNLDDLPNGKSCTVVVQANAGGSATVYAGFGQKFTGLGSGNTITIGVTGFATIRNTGTNANHSNFVTAHDTATYTTETAPTPTKTVYFAGQSNAQRAYLYGAIPACAAAMRDTSWVSSSYDEIIRFMDASSGGSCEDEAGDTGAGHWWDRSLNSGTGGAGSLLTAALADMATDAPTDIVWDCGETVTQALDDGDLTRANLVTSITEIFAAFRAAHASVNIHVNMIGSRDDDRFDGAGTAVRDAYLDVIASLSYVYQGIEKYDLERPYNDLHLSVPGFQAYGARLARHLVNVWDSQTNSLGPTITSAVLSGGGTTATVVFTSVDNMQPMLGRFGGGVSSGPHPFGIHVYSSSDPIASTIALTGGLVTATTDTTVTVEVYSDSDMTGADLMVVQGGMYDACYQDYAADVKDVGHFGATGFPVRCGRIVNLST
jgi:hypothetical protein